MTPTRGDAIVTKTGKIGVVTSTPWTSADGTPYLAYRATWAGVKQGPTRYTKVANVTVVDTTLTNTPASRS
jgi:hypothetical protein